MRGISLAYFRWLHGDEIWTYNQNRFLPIVKQALESADGVVVDAACGFRNTYLERLPVGASVGIDIDGSVREKNCHHSEFVIQDLHDEIELNDMGAVISVNTVEHLENPEVVLNNFHSILKNEAPLIIVAPQKYYYVSLLALVLPTPIQNLAWRLAKNRSRMPYPAYFQLCSQKSLASAAARVGFDLVTYRPSDVATNWFLKVPPLFLLACGWMAIVNRVEWLSPLRSSFVAVLRKR